MVSMKIKIEFRMLNPSQITICDRKPVVVYDIYHGFTGIPNTLPFMTKWVIDKAGLSEDEMLDYMKHYLSTCGKIKLVIKYGGIRG